MKLLLDTHILLWTLAGDSRLTKSAVQLIDHPSSEIYYSVVSPWETGIKYAANPDKMDLSAEQLIQYCEEAGFQILSVTGRHIQSFFTLQRIEGAPEHRDPFDKMLIAQAKEEGMQLLTHDRQFLYYQEPCVIFV